MKFYSIHPCRPRLGVLRLAAIGSAGLGLACNSYADTTVTFGGFTGSNSLISDLIGFGDNVTAVDDSFVVSPSPDGKTGTPDITLDWLGSRWDTYIEWDGRGNVAQADFNGGTPLSIQFNPAAGIAVGIASFELDEWAGGGDASVAWSISGATSGVLASGTWLGSALGGRDLLTPGVHGAAGEVVTLTFQLNAGAPSYVALDNLTFLQVPEPATGALAALGGSLALGAAAMRRRRAR